LLFIAIWLAYSLYYFLYPSIVSPYDSPNIFVANFLIQFGRFPTASEYYYQNSIEISFMMYAVNYLLASISVLKSPPVDISQVLFPFIVYVTTTELVRKYHSDVDNQATVIIGVFSSAGAIFYEFMFLAGGNIFLVYDFMLVILLLYFKERPPSQVSLLMLVLMLFLTFYYYTGTFIFISFCFMVYILTIIYHKLDKKTSILLYLITSTILSFPFIYYSITQGVSALMWLNGFLNKMHFSTAHPEIIFTILAFLLTLFLSILIKFVLKNIFPRKGFNIVRKAVSIAGLIAIVVFLIIVLSDFQEAYSNPSLGGQFPPPLIVPSNRIIRLIIRFIVFLPLIVLGISILKKIWSAKQFSGPEQIFTILILTNIPLAVLYYLWGSLGQLAGRGQQIFYFASILFTCLFYYKIFNRSTSGAPVRDNVDAGFKKPVIIHKFYIIILEIAVIITYVFFFALKTTILFIFCSFVIPAYFITKDMAWFGVKKLNVGSRIILGVFVEIVLFYSILSVLVAFQILPFSFSTIFLVSAVIPAGFFAKNIIFSFKRGKVSENAATAVNENQ